MLHKPKKSCIYLPLAKPFGIRWKSICYMSKILLAFKRFRVESFVWNFENGGCIQNIGFYPHARAAHYTWPIRSARSNLVPRLFKREEPGNEVAPVAEYTSNHAYRGTWPSESISDASVTSISLFWHFKIVIAVEISSDSDQKCKYDNKRWTFEDTSLRIRLYIVFWILRWTRLLQRGYVAMGQSSVWRNFTISSC
jgi:hypothetical protein